MAVHTSLDQNDTQGTISLSVKGIPTLVGQAMKEISKARDINTSVLLREMVNGPMSNMIHVFCLKSQLVNSLDIDIAQYIGGSFTPAWTNTAWSSQTDISYKELLGIHTEDDLTRILLQNAQFLRLRASQCIPRGTLFVGGISMYLALFCEVARRDEGTIESHWANIARYWGPWYRRQDYYYQINQLRNARDLPSANTLTEAHATGVYSHAAILQTDPAQAGYSQVLLTLRTENTNPLPRNALDSFPLPFCPGNILTPDPGYGVPLTHANSLGMGFRFTEDTSSLHCYSVHDERIGQTQTLSEVAHALVTVVDEQLRPYASTFPVSK
ncbi:hypothetical protein [Dickeya zeae]|nr:hypothetical protein [Dickeya zeae]